MFTLAPSVYAADHTNLRSQIRLLEESGVTCLHVDVMDGKFVQLRAFGPETVEMLRKYTDLKLDVHLMVEDPERQLEAFAAVGTDSLTVHFEACASPLEVLRKIHSLGMEAGLAIAPCTLPAELGRELWDEMDVLHVMTKNPGRDGQHFIPEMYDRVRCAKELISAGQRPVRIEVDGDITPERLRPIMSAGAEIIVVGGALFEGDIRQNVRTYMETGMSVSPISSRNRSEEAYIGENRLQEETSAAEEGEITA